MGLDWNPGPKAKAGSEAEFEVLWREMHAPSGSLSDGKDQRFREITTSAFDTLGAPTVGTDDAATEWARQQFGRRKDKSLTEVAFLRRLTGFRVLPLVPPCDGVPRYSNGRPGGDVEPYSFRGKFLEDCEKVIGPELLKLAFASKLPLDTVTYGRELLQRAAAVAAAHQIDLTAVHLVKEPETDEFRLDAVQCAGRWCLFWGERGHWLEAYY